MIGRVLVVASDEAAVRRLPRRVGSGASSVPVHPGTFEELDDEDVVAAILIDAEPADVHDAAAAGRPLLVDLPTLRRLGDAGDVTSLLSARWLPLLPLRRAVDVAAAAQLLADGLIGRTHGGQIVTPVGEPSHPSWELDHQPARNRFEALAYGLDLLAALGHPVAASHLASGAVPPVRVEHRTSDDVVFVQWLLPAQASSAPEFRASLIGGEGTMWLRAPFAPGSVTVWENAAERYRSIRLRRDTPNIQAPDTVRGGLEVQRLLTELLGETKDDEDEIRDASLRAVRAAAAVLAELSPASEGAPQ